MISDLVSDDDGDAIEVVHEVSDGDDGDAVEVVHEVSDDDAVEVVHEACKFASTVSNGRYGARRRSFDSRRARSDVGDSEAEAEEDDSEAEAEDGAASSASHASSKTMVHTVSWQVDEIRTTDDVVQHKSPLFTCYLGPLRRLRFHLILKIREDSYEVLIESLQNRDYKLRMALFIESNGTRQTKHFEGYTVPGRFEDASQLHPLIWGHLQLFGLEPGGRWMDGGATARGDFIALPTTTIQLNIFTRQRYGVPDFLPLAATEDRDSSMTKDMLSAFENETGANLTVHCQGKTIRCQSGILVSRSEVFAAMLQHDFQEKSSSEVHINDMSPEAVEELVRFLYTDTVKDMETHALELLIAANKYNLPLLKLKCEQGLCEALSDENVVPTLTLAHVHNAPNAKAFAVQCVVDNFPDIIETAGWQRFAREYPDLLRDVHAQLAKKLTELAEMAGGADDDAF